MKKVSIFFLTSLFLTQSFCQISNVKAGLWSDLTVWSNNTLPTSIDNIALNFDIIVDINASCRSLTLNGHNAVVNSGINFNISGRQNTTNPTQTGTSLLKKFIVFDSAQSSPNDTIYIYNYTYDNARRCTQIKIKDFQNNSIGYIFNYYNATDTLITARKLINQVYADSVFEYFNYSANGGLLSDSVITYNSNGVYTSTYKYQSVNNLIESTISANGQPFMMGKYSVTKDNMGNIISEKDSGFIYSSGSYYNSSETNIQTVYDTYPCPFYKLYPKRLIELDYELATTDDLTPYFGILQKNNATSKTRVSLSIASGLGNWNNTYQYSYNSIGLPYIVIYKDQVSGDIYKGLYFY